MSGAPLGHEIRGVDVANLSEEEFAAVEAAYDKYGVVVLRNQTLTPAQHVAYSKRFGGLDRYILDKYNMKSQPGDLRRLEHHRERRAHRPRRRRALLALRHVDAGEAAARLDHVRARGAARRQRQAARRHDVRQHAGGLRRAARRPSAGDRRPARRVLGHASSSTSRPSSRAASSRRTSRTRWKSARRSCPSISHPMVRVHPRTGRKCIYYSEGAVSHIEGMSVGGIGADPRGGARARAAAALPLPPRVEGRRRRDVGQLLLHPQGVRRLRVAAAPPHASHDARVAVRADPCMNAPEKGVQATRPSFADRPHRHAVRVGAAAGADQASVPRRAHEVQLAAGRGAHDRRPDRVRLRVDRERAAVLGAQRDRARPRRRSCAGSTPRAPSSSGSACTTSPSTSCTTARPISP